MMRNGADYAVYINTAQEYDGRATPEPARMRLLHIVKKKRNTKSTEAFSTLSEAGFDPGTCGLWAHHASAAPL
ncbi:hypothetical protein V6N11_059027 [Hibiscus sabdariffa]|uniref:Uncharacterized protein n=1 Tax=Hibiscus sabdariffa TaxID=183260 RepID=A0ABR2U5Y1_9ROSI